MALAFQLQRLVTRLGVAVALSWGVLAGAPLRGLWAAAWIVGLMCGGIGALIHEYDATRPGNRYPVHADGRRVRTSGFCYLAVAIVAGVFPPGLAAALLLGVVVDFWAGHYVAAAERRLPTLAGT